MPLWIFVPAAVGALVVVAPLAAMFTRIEWSNFFGLVSSDSAVAALILSLKTASASTVLCVLLGVPMAIVLSRSTIGGLSILRSLVVLPLVLPPVVGGIALLYTFGRQGLLGEHLEAFGIRIAFTTSAVVLAQVFVSLPFLVVSVEGALRTAGERYDVVAATLGATRWTTFRRVTLPLALPGLVAGAVLAWARSLGEFGATITFAGNFPGTTQTMPSLIYTTLQADPAAARTLSMILLVVSVGVLAGLRHRWLRPL